MEGARREGRERQLGQGRAECAPGLDIWHNNTLQTDGLSGSLSAVARPGWYLASQVRISATYPEQAKGAVQAESNAQVLGAHLLPPRPSRWQASGEIALL